MNDLGDTPNRALLPPGFTDTLAPKAMREAAAVSAILTHFAAFGFVQVKPPLVEFEETLFGGIGSSKRDQSFRVMDPVSRQMLAVRPDMTVQIARIAASRLAGEPRPLRLSYAGQVLRVTAGQVRPERQFTQLGAEIIGAGGVVVDTHIISLAVRALGLIGIGGVSVDLSVPGLITSILPNLMSPGPDSADLAKAIEGKDVATVAQLSGDKSKLIIALINAGGPADEALASVSELSLPVAGREMIDRLAATVRGLERTIPDTALTIDFVERRGFEYQSGVSFTLFAKSLREELGRGGGYMAGEEFGSAEPASGVSLFMDSILRGLPGEDEPKRVLVPHDLTASDAADLHHQGWTTVYALEDGLVGSDEAKRQGCSHMLLGSKINPVEG
ncbi:MAG: ATP phosphoribosyltransferase regulatory subunit [Pseudomonadota bacterium]